ncbi:MAG: tetratricopeptide repeat protein [Alphaproteobacteria bacterium]|nr:tetratricopeptide repeat protein [Alphaproteobacteria bacterium]
MSRARLPLLPTGLLCAALLTACAPKPRGPEVATEAPAWKTEEGRKEVWKELARWYIDNKMPQEALDMVQRLRDAGEENTELQVIQARALSAQNVPEEAEHLLLDVVASNPKNAEAVEALGVVQADLGKLDEALASFQRALKLSPDDAGIRNNLAFLYFVTGRCDDAVSQFEEVVELDATNARYRNNLAFALVCAGDQQRALQLFRSTGEESMARYNMGVAFERQEKWPSAALQYQEALTADPDNATAAEALARVQLEHPTLMTPTPGAP